jgi:hypothetical protein
MKLKFRQQHFVILNLFQDNGRQRVIPKRVRDDETFENRPL